jgi:glycosyltransferase involved in cell wall biosynthesis
MKIFVVSAYSLSFKVLSVRLQPPWTAILWKVRTFGNKFRFNSKGIFILEESVNFLRLLLSPTIYKKDCLIICENCPFSVLMFGKWLRVWGIQKRIYLFHFFLHSLGNAAAIRKILKFLLDQEVGIMAFSSSERDYFKNLSPKADVRFTPWCGEPGFEVDPLQIENGDYIFSGGHSNRDYDVLIHCARKLPQTRFIIVCSKRNVMPEPIPANVKIFKDITPKNFHTLLARSKAVVIPLKNNVGASGQMAALAAMEFGKPAVYTDFDVVSQYFENGTNGLKYQAGNLDSLMLALSLILNDQSVCTEMGRQARLRWERAFKGNEMEQAIVNHLTDFMGIPL